MSKRRIQAITWRKVNQATVDTLKGESAGQYDIRLGSTEEFDKFFGPLPHYDPTDRGGFKIDVPIAEFDGSDPVGATVITVRCMGEEAQRANEWYIRAQRPDTAYPLWKLGRGVKQDREYSDSSTSYIYIVKSEGDEFHARWIDDENLGVLPEQILDLFGTKDIGVHFFEEAPLDGLQKEVYQALIENQNVLLYGPPGTGKSHLMQGVARSFDAPIYYLRTEEEVSAIGEIPDSHSCHLWITFHQSYSYEEFIMGLRTATESEHLLELVAVPGPLLELAEFARLEDSRSLLVIDEINRGNVSRIFGEFITIMEPDKRLGPDGQKTPNSVGVRLPYLGSKQSVEVSVMGHSSQVSNPYYMPFRVYTLASMNSVDKSVAPLDAAIRRRFHIIRLEPDPEEFAKQISIDAPVIPEDWPAGSDELTEVDDIVRLGISAIDYLNRQIAHFMGPEYMLGFWYLADLVHHDGSLQDAKEKLATTWRSKIRPQLLELFQARPDQLRAVLGESITDGADSPIRVVQPRGKVAELGGLPYVSVTEVEADKTLDLLLKLVSLR